MVAKHQQRSLSHASVGAFPGAGCSGAKIMLRLKLKIFDLPKECDGYPLRGFVFFKSRISVLVILMYFEYVSRLIFCILTRRSATTSRHTHSSIPAGPVPTGMRRRGCLEVWWEFLLRWSCNRVLAAIPSSFDVSCLPSPSARDAPASRCCCSSPTHLKQTRNLQWYDKDD